MLIILYFKIEPINFIFFKNVDVSQKVDTLTSLITGLVADNYAAGQTFQIATPSISMNIQKLQASDLPPVLNVSNALIKLPSFCSLLTNTQAITTTTTKSPYVSLSDSNNCTNRIITLKVTIYLTIISLYTQPT